MISNQIIQSALDELQGITRIDLCVADLQGRIVAATYEDSEITEEIITNFAASQAEGQTLQAYHFFKVYDNKQLAYILISRGMSEDAYMIGKVAVSQIQTLIVAYKERYDKNNFVQNLLLDNLLLVDVYNQAKKLLIDLETKRVVYLIETKYEKDIMALETVRSLFAPESQDVITAVDEKNIVVVKEIRDQEDHENLENIAKMLVDMLNTEAMTKVRISYGTVVNHLKDVSKSYKEAAMAMDVGRIFYPNKMIIPYYFLGIGRLIYQLPTNLCEMFMKETFEGEKPSALDEETLGTIHKFFENNLNVSETSRQLFIHRNTLVYRLEKIQRTTGLDIRNFEDALTFKIGLMVDSYLKYLDTLE